MRAVVQRVRSGSVKVHGEYISRIGRGLVVLLGVGDEDKEEDARYLAKKIAYLRIFEDEAGKMNLSVLDLGGEVLTVSQFTLYGDCAKGRRPSFTQAAPPGVARELYQLFISELQKKGISTGTGVFQEHMVVALENDGPVTILIDSRK